jgi:hypothetical protein
MARSSPLSAFGEYVAEACRDAGTTPFALSRASGSSPSVLTYCMRKPAAGVKAYPPPLRCLDAWCDALKLTGAKRQRFLVLAWLEHAPEPLRDYVHALELRAGRREVRAKRK